MRQIIPQLIDFPINCEFVVVRQLQRVHIPSGMSTLEVGSAYRIFTLRLSLFHFKLTTFKFKFVEFTLSWLFFSLLLLRVRVNVTVTGGQNHRRLFSQLWEKKLFCIALEHVYSVLLKFCDQKVLKQVKFRHTDQKLAYRSENSATRT